MLRRPPSARSMQIRFGWYLIKFNRLVSSMLQKKRDFQSFNRPMYSRSLSVITYLRLSRYFRSFGRAEAPGCPWARDALRLGVRDFFSFQIWLLISLICLLLPNNIYKLQILLLILLLLLLRWGCDIRTTSYRERKASLFRSGSVQPRSNFA